jgi:hypothetical protein
VHGRGGGGAARERASACPAGPRRASEVRAAGAPRRRVRGVQCRATAVDRGAAAAATPGAAGPCSLQWEANVILTQHPAGAHMLPYASASTTACRGRALRGRRVEAGAGGAEALSPSKASPCLLVWPAVLATQPRALSHPHFSLLSHPLSPPPFPTPVSHHDAARPVVGHCAPIDREELPQQDRELHPAGRGLRREAHGGRGAGREHAARARGLRREAGPQASWVGAASRAPRESVAKRTQPRAHGFERAA